MKKYIILLIAGFLFFQSCEKKESVPLDMEITLDKTSYRVGEEVLFHISGNPDQLTFYSGEQGHKYVFRERLKAEPSAITLAFATNRRYGSDAQQPNSLRLLASQTFSGNYTSDALNEEDWVDITAAFTLSGIQASDNTYQESGLVDLSTLSSIGLQIAYDKPIYFAFKYTGVTGSTQPRWWINAFDLNTITTDGVTLAIADLQSAAWTSVGLDDSPVAWMLNANGLRFQGGGAAVGSNNVWAITTPLDLTSVTPDQGLALKNISTRMDQYVHVYEEPGEYEVTFVGANTNIYGGNAVVKTVRVLVTEN